MSTLPPAAIRLCPQRGKKDCAIAALASYLRVSYEEVLIAASQISRTAWDAGLSGPEVLRVAKKLGFKAKWRTLDKNDLDALDDLTGILDLRFWHQELQHVVLLVDGTIYELGDNPVTRWEPLAYCRFHNTYPAGLLEIVE